MTLPLTMRFSVCNRVIFRYREEKTPHFVFYCRRENGFRFMNVADGLEDAVMPMEKFGEEHLKGRLVVLFFVV